MVGVWRNTELLSYTPRTSSCLSTTNITWCQKKIDDTMAGLHGLSPPEPLLLRGNLSENLRICEQQFEIYMEATGLAAESEKRRANVLLHVIGPESVHVYNGFTWDDLTHRMQPDKILDKFRTYSTPRFGLVYWGLTPLQQRGSYQGSEMMMMKSVIWTTTDECDSIDCF